MIPDFNTYIKESHWSEMNRRSQGIVVRKEDDIDLMDINHLKTYVKDHYAFKGDSVYLNEKGDRLIVYIFSTLYEGHPFHQLLVFQMKDDKKSVIVAATLKEDDEELFNKLIKKYKARGDHYPYPVDYEVTPADKTKPVTNKFFLEVLDFIIDNVSPSEPKHMRKKEIEKK